MTRPTVRALASAFQLATVAAALAAPAAASAQSSSTVLGGWRPTATDGEIVQQAGAALAERVGGELASVDSAQSGGGLSYRLEITLADGARWSGTVGIRLPDRTYVVSGEPLQLSPPPGEGNEVDTGSNQAPDDDDE